MAHARRGARLPPSSRSPVYRASLPPSWAGLGGGPGVGQRPGEKDSLEKQGGREYGLHAVAAPRGAPPRPYLPAWGGPAVSVTITCPLCPLYLWCPLWAASSQGKRGAICPSVCEGSCTALAPAGPQPGAGRPGPPPPRPLGAGPGLGASPTRLPVHLLLQGLESGQWPGAPRPARALRTMPSLPGQ